MARQRYTVEQVVEALHKSRGAKTTAAEALGCTDETVNNYEKRYLSVRQVIAHYRERRIDVAESKLDAALDKGEAWAVMFTLKTQGKSRGYVERQEVSGPGGTRFGIEVKAVDYRTAITALAPGSVDDSDASGES